MGSNPSPLSREGVGHGPRPSRAWWGFGKVRFELLIPSSSNYSFVGLKLHPLREEGGCLQSMSMLPKVTVFPRSAVPFARANSLLFSLNRFFHDGVRLQAGRVAAALSQIRTLARLLSDDSFPTPKDTGRENQNDDTNIASRRRRRGSSSSSGRRRYNQQRLTPDQLFSETLPATILLSYDSCSTGFYESDRCSGGREDEGCCPVDDDGSCPAKEETDRLARDGHRQSPRQRLRESVSLSSPSRAGSVDGRRRGERGEAAGGSEREGSGVELRVVEFMRAGGVGSQREQAVCRGVGQVG